MHEQSAYVIAVSAVLSVGNLGSACASTGAQLQDASSPPGFSIARTGGVHDFDFLVGGWTTQQRRLKVRGVGNTEWQPAPSNRHCARAYLDGAAVVDEGRFPDSAPSGLFINFFDAQKSQWSIRWIGSKTGKMDPGVVGGFEGAIGEFYGEDVDNGRPIKVRYTWTKIDHTHARWEQAYSFDNRTWETNWISNLARTDASGICD